VVIIIIIIIHKFVYHCKVVISEAVVLIIWSYYFKKILRICLSASFTQYTVTITQVQESVSDFNSESGDFYGLKSVRSPNFFIPGVGVPQKMRTLHPCFYLNFTCQPVLAVTLS